MHSDELNKSDSGVMMQIFRPLRKFFMGRIYPAIVAALVLIGHVTALEYYFNIPIIPASAECHIFGAYKNVPNGITLHNIFSRFIVVYFNLRLIPFIAV